MKQHKIYDIEGNVLYEGKAPTKKAFVRLLIEEGVPLINANLKGIDLSRMDLSHKDFAGSNLDGADLRGSKLDRANFKGASLQGVNASGVSAVQTDFSNTKLGRIEIRGEKYSSMFRDSILTTSKWDGAEISYTKFENSSLTSSTFVGSSVWKTDFTKCRLHNVDWVESNVVTSNFTKADLTPTMTLGHKHLPDRTLRAKIYGNIFKDTEIGVGNIQFKADKIWNKISTYKMWAGGTIAATVAIDFALAGGVSGLSMMSSLTGISGETVMATVGKFGAGAFILGAGMLLKTKVEEWVADAYSTFHAKANLHIRQTIADTVSRGINLCSLAVLVASPSTNKMIGKYMKLSKDSLYKKMCETLNGELEVILCNRKSLAKALAKMCDAMVDRVPLDRRVVLARIEDKDDNGPKMFVINTDGSTEALWSHHKFGETIIKWDVDGNRISGNPNENLAHSESDRNTAIDYFMKKIVLDHNVPEFNFNSKTHAVRVGRDGSAVVVNRARGILQNPKGPVVLTPGDEAIYKAVDTDNLRRRVEEMKAGIIDKVYKPKTVTETEKEGPISEAFNNYINADEEENDTEIKVRMF